MKCEEAKLKAQALVDNELPEQEIATVMEHIQSCYHCRNEYIHLLALQRKMSGVGQPVPADEWFDSLPKRVGRKVTSLIGQVLFIGSYLVLLAYALFSLFSDDGEGLFIKVVIGAIVAGVLVLLGTAVTDRMRESKTDRYKGVMR